MGCEKAVDSRSSVVVRGCTQLSCLCTLPKTCFYRARFKTESTVRWHASARSNTHCTRTDKQTDWGKRKWKLCDSDSIHTATLTFNISPCVVIVLFQIQRSVSRTADKHNNKKSKKHCARNFSLKKSNEYFKLALVLWYFWSSFSLCSCDRAHLECLVELVSLDSLERRSAFPLSDCTTCVCADSEEVVVCVWACVPLCVWCVCWSFQIWKVRGDAEVP